MTLKKRSTKKKIRNDIPPESFDTTAERRIEGMQYFSPSTPDREHRVMDEGEYKKEYQQSADESDKVSED